MRGKRSRASETSGTTPSPDGIRSANTVEPTTSLERPDNGLWHSPAQVEAAYRAEARRESDNR
jgi:hypothetical protein